MEEASRSFVRRKGSYKKLLGRMLNWEGTLSGLGLRGWLLSHASAYAHALLWLCSSLTLTIHSKNLKHSTDRRETRLRIRIRYTDTWMIFGSVWAANGKIAGCSRSSETIHDQTHEVF